MKKAYITGATGAIGMALVGELLKNGISTTVFLRKGSGRNDRVKDSFSGELASGLLRIEYVSLEELSGYTAKKDAQDIQAYTSQECILQSHAPQSHVLRECVLQSYEPQSYASQESASQSYTQHNVSRKILGITDTAVFYHLGWSGTFGEQRNDAGMQQKNVEYTLDAVRLAMHLGCTHFIGAGSQAEYGRFEGRLTPATRTLPENEYGRAKLAAGIRSAELCRELGLRHSWVRVLSVYGPFDGRNTMIMSVIRGLLSGERVALTKGEQIWNYLYSGDAARALFMLGASSLSVQSRTYCLAGEAEGELREYILRLCRAAGADESLLGFGEIPYGSAQVMYLTADINRLWQDVGFVPETTFDDGIKKTIEWVRAYGIPLYGY